MSARVRNSLAAERERLGWSQARMAEAAEISRQSYAAIESSSAVPSTEIALRLSAALGRPVEELFRLADRPGQLRTAAWSGGGTPNLGDRVRTTSIGGRWIAHPSAEAHRQGEPADGVVEGVAGKEVEVRLFEQVPPSTSIAAVGCDPAFGIVVEGLRRERGLEVNWTQRGSRAALLTLARGEAHIAGVHLRDPDSAGWNAHWVRELVPFSCTRVAFAVWEQGLLIRPDATRRIDGVGDLAAKGVRLLNREEGSGSRALLDAALVQAGVQGEAIEGYRTEARGHLSVADGVAAGAADTGVAIRAAGRARRLGFVPLGKEAYELVIPDHFLDHPAVDAVLTSLGRAAVRRQVEALGGYDVTGMGSVTS